LVTLKENGQSATVTYTFTNVSPYDLWFIQTAPSLNYVLGDPTDEAEFDEFDDLPTYQPGGKPIPPGGTSTFEFLFVAPNESDGSDFGLYNLDPFSIDGASYVTLAPGSDQSFRRRTISNCRCNRRRRAGAQHLVALYHRFCDVVGIRLANARSGSGKGVLNISSYEKSAPPRYSARPRA
jgi:hypothetical protein